MDDEVSCEELFGRLSVCQPRRGYRYSIDAFLLAGFVRLKPGELAVEFGSGCGIVSLILALRFPGARILGLEVQKRLALLAARNLKTSGLQDRVLFLRADVREARQIIAASVDVVLANPPYRPLGTGRLNPLEEETVARHEVLLDLRALLAAAAAILKERGRLYLIYPASRLVALLAESRRLGLEPKRLQVVHSYPGDYGRLVLFEARKGAGEELRILPPFFIYQAPGGPYTSQAEGLFRL
ncbi:methyltransferase [Thermosulfuriphilus ammonigenes]|uniref:Methyltransferase n=1 Tax=Thermosulfuriphilus ammonigenes TaxID=1936021 RepID=A0A6G7PXA1_9BACT|nr:methyltransferase [Thermosulfuriphilus ammonigenes]MBA2849576.1 tRNA1Val (adenine37-N6)-methyltransferase [Thermosulfuriphilus ammonigenes]QIJ72319.1 methyltransferase [Thermosulfuriphilus ammonigenes]